MKKIYFTTLVLFIILGCSKNEHEIELLGIWNNFPSANGASEIRFYTDSVILIDYNFKRKGSWTANDSKIEFHFPKEFEGYKNNLTYNYNIYSINDSLVLRDSNNSKYVLPTFFKIRSYWKHYLREIGLEIELPEASFEIQENKKSNFGIDIYVGFEQDSLKTISNLRTLKSINDYEAVVISMKYIRPIEDEKYLHFNLIADRNVSKKDLDSISGILQSFEPLKIFRVYEKENANYGKYDYSGQGNHWNWHGKFK